MGLLLRNQSHAAGAMPVLAVLLALTSLGWVPWPVVTGWLGAMLVMLAFQTHVCRSYLEAEQRPEPPAARAIMLWGTELLAALFWCLPLFLFWPGATVFQQISLLAWMMAVVAMRLLIVGHFVPVLVAGTGFITLGVAVRCATVSEPAYLLVAVGVIALEALFLLVAQELHSGAREMLAQRAQRDALIESLQAELRRTRDEKRRAEDASQAKSAFIARMSHDLRTPLNAIMGFSEALRREMLGPVSEPSYKGYARDIQQSGRYLTALLNGLIDLSRIEAGRLDGEDEPVSLHAAVEEACQFVRAQAAEKAIGISVELPETLPRLMADRRGLGQILMNLVSDAIEFIPHGGRVTLRAGRSQDGGLYVSITDDGPGLSLAAGEPGIRSLSAPGLPVGAGLGLSIARELAEAHGASLSVGSTAGMGNEITVSFPEGRVLTGPRGEVLSASAIASETQRKLITLTG